MVYTCSVDDCMPVKFPDGSRNTRNRLVKGVKSMLTIFDPQAEVSPIVSTMKTKVSVKICYCQCGKSGHCTYNNLVIVYINLVMIYIALVIA